MKFFEVVVYTPLRGAYLLIHLQNLVFTSLSMMKKKIKSQTAKIRIAPFVSIFVFLVLGAVGISLGEPSRVLEQATQICLSCIGLG